MRPDIFLADAMSKNIIFWLGVFVVSMLVMVQPARAETIAATSSNPPTVSGFSSYYQYGLTKEQVCARVGAAQQFIATVNGDWCRAPYGDFSLITVAQVCAPNYDTGATSCPAVYSCPPNQNWTLSGSNCTRPDCVLPQVRNISTGVCESPTCPYTYLGIETSRGYKFSTTNHTAYAACDVHSCEVSISPVATVFGVSLLHQVATPNACVGITEPALIVTITEEAAPTSPDKTKFDDVVAAAAAVDAARTEQARQDAYIAKVVADGIKAKIAADTAAAEAAVAAQKQAVADVKRKAGEVTANPTTTNINNYNNAVTNYNNTVSVVSNAITQLQDDYAVQVANENNAQDSVNDASAIKAKIDALKDAIAASGQPYNPADVAEKTAGDTALADQLAAATASLAEAAAELAKAAAAASQAAADIAAAGKSLADTAAAIKRLLDGLPLCITNPADPSCKPVVPFCVEHPTDPTCQPPPNTPFCVDHPTDPACVPPPSTDCSKTPDAPGCKPVDCTVSPNAPGCMDICKDHPERAGCTDLGTVSDDVPLDEKTVTISAITPVSVGGAGACPAPIPMVLHGQTYYMKFDTYCNFATGIKPIILVFAWLAATGILIGGFKAS